MSKKRGPSREEWELELWERQHNLGEADITRRSQFRASGLPKDAPLPIRIRQGRIWMGIAVLVIPVILAALFGNRWAGIACFATGAVGLYLIATSVRWTAR